MPMPRCGTLGDVFLCFCARERFCRALVHAGCSIAAPLLFLVWQKWRWNFAKRCDLWLFAAIMVLPSVAWYWHAHQIAEKFYPHHFFGEGGIRIENFSWYWGIARRTTTSGLTPILSMMALSGLFVAPRSR